jgi:predicted nucleic acid-binding protein
MILVTNAISGLAGRDLTLARIVDTSDHAALAFVAVAEYRFGILGSAKRSVLQRTLDGLLEILPLLFPDRETLEVDAELSHHQKKIERPSPSNDLRIAALARQHDLPILSRNRHFDFIPNIQRVDW